MTTKTQSTLTVDLFFQEIMPAIEDMMDKKIGEVKNDVLDYKVETVGELKKLREEVTTTLHQYERSDKRLDRIEEELDLPPIDY